MPTEIKVDGAEDGNAQVIVTRVISSGYFETVGTQVITGRGFQPTDSQKAPPVVIVSQAMARYCSRTRARSAARSRGAWVPIGRRRPRLSAWRPTPTPTASTEKPKMTLYRPDTQANAVSTLLVRTAGSADLITPRVVETIRSLDPNRPVDHVQTLRSCAMKRSRRSG